MTTTKLQMKLVNKESQEIWAAVLMAKAEVDGWPAWKRGR